MSLYPSLEDMKVSHMSAAQIRAEAHGDSPVSTQSSPYNPGVYNAGQVYPSLGDYMGLELTETVIRDNMPEYLSQQISIYQQSNTVPAGTTTMVAPISGSSLGLQRAQVTHGIRELVLCKDKDGKIGLRVRDVNKGVFVSLVIDKSPAALAGLRFGDQILQINGTDVAGFSMDKVHDLLKKCPVNGIRLAVRDRPFERTITLHKDSTGCLGFQYKNGKIITIVKDSSASRNGVLIDHQLLEVDGRNVVGVKDKEIKDIIDKAGQTVTITVIPSFMYDHMISKMSGSLIKNLMDHSVPTI